MDSSSFSGAQTARTTGKNAEQYALRYLLSHGLNHVESNFSCRHGEIDLVMRDNHSLVFVEVRYRSQLQFGSGADTVDFRKQKKILNTAEFYLQQHVNYNHYPCRIDVISIGPGKSEINWIKNAFGA